MHVAQLKATQLSPRNGGDREHINSVWRSNGQEFSKIYG